MKIRIPPAPDANIPGEVVQRFPALRVGPLRLTPVVGGFSGALVHRAEVAGQAFALRAWPPQLTPAELGFLHAAQLELTAAGFTCTPRLERTDNGATWVEVGGRLWELAGWRPGQAEPRFAVVLPRLRQAARALGELQTIWSRRSPPTDAVSEAVSHRVTRLGAWTPARRQAAEALLPMMDDELRPLLRAALTRLDEETPGALMALRPWLGRPLPHQRALTDLWRDHLLFTGDELTGIVDLGGVRVETPAVALGRLLSSLAGADVAAWAVGVTAFREAHPFGAAEEELLGALRRTATAGGLETWLRWLLLEGRPLATDPRVKARLRELLAPPAW